MARTKVTSRECLPRVVVIGGLAPLTRSSKRRLLLLLEQEKEKTLELRQQLVHAQDRVNSVEKRMVEAELRVALLEQTRAKAVKLLAADIKEVRRLDGTINVALVCS